MIIRNPSQIQLDAICKNPNVDLRASIDQCIEGNVSAIIDGRLNNTAQTEVSGIDFSGSYGFEIENIGSLLIRVNGSYLIDFKEAISSAAEITERVDTLNSPVDLRMRNSISWTNDNGLSVSTFVNYTDSYTDRVSFPERKIDSYTTIDLNIAYNTGENFSKLGLNNTVISLNVLNIFDEDPPFVNNNALFSTIGFDPANANPLGRFVAFNITKKW